MGNAACMGRVGALAVALGVGNLRFIATQVTVAVGAAALVLTIMAVPEPDSTTGSAVRLAADSTALLVCGDTCPTWHESDVEIIMDQFITPTHLGQTITPVAVTTPSEAWPITGLLRLIGVAFGDPRVFGPGGSAWPDEPLWKLSGLFDLTADQSALAGVASLEAAMAEHGNDHLVIYGESAGANTVNKEKRKLAAQYPPGTTAPDIEFVLEGDPNVPNGGLAARFPGLRTVILGTFDGPEPTNTQFHTDVINRQYDGAADFPLYPLNIIADLNAVMGFLYVHTNAFDISLAPDASTSPAYQGTHGDSSYYLFPTEDLPLFAPLRQLGVPESLIDVVEPFFRVLVELGYDRSIPPWEPTPARLIPPLNPGKVIADLADAISEGLDNAVAATGSVPTSSGSAPVAFAAHGTETASAQSSEESPSAQTGRTAFARVAPGVGQASTAMAVATTEGVETANTDVQHPSPTEAETQTGREPSVKTAVDETGPDDASNGPTTGATREPSLSASTSDSGTPTERLKTPRIERHRPLAVGQQLANSLRSGRKNNHADSAPAGARTAEPASAGESSDGEPARNDTDGS